MLLFSLIMLFHEVSHVNVSFKIIFLVTAQNFIVFKYILFNLSPIVEPLDSFQFLLLK